MGKGVGTVFAAYPILIKIEAPRIGFDFGRRSDGASERRRLFGTKKRRRKRCEACDDVVAGRGFEPTDLRVMSSYSAVLHRPAKCRKPA